MEMIIEIVAVAILYIATDIGRTKECEIIIFSKNWWIILILIIIGVSILMSN